MRLTHALVGKDGFRLRGAEMSRVDGFSDVVFGFALTLIVVSLEVPKTYSELHELLLSFPGFLVCFVFLIMVWSAHFRFFRRFGTHDAGTILINAALLFTLLFYVYPLKFLFTLLGHQITGHVPAETFQSNAQIRELMVVYGAGFAAIYFCIVGLYWNAYRQRECLGLNALERQLTVAYIWDDFGVACTGLLCCLVAELLPAAHAGNAGLVFFFIGIWKTAHGFFFGRKLRKLREAAPTVDETTPMHPA